MKLPILYSRTSTGKIQEWEIEVEDNKHRTIAGQQEGKKTTSKWTTCDGKNKGRANETTADEQAMNEAQAKWQKKVDKKYFIDIEEIDNRPFEPMLAKKWEDRETKVKFDGNTYGQAKLDGCLQGNTKILTKEGLIPIRKIVDKKISTKVLSYNIKKNKTEFKPIVNWFNNGKATEKEWVIIKIENGQQIKCTRNHKVLTKRGWIQADELDDTNDKIMSNVGSSRLASLILGTYLGDSSIFKDVRMSGKNAGFMLKFAHSKKELADDKIRILNLPGRYKIDTSDGFKKNRVMHVFQTNPLHIEFPLTKLMYISHGGKGRINERKLLEYKFLKSNLTLESLSMWIADDGSLALNNGNKFTPRLSLHTEGFDEAQINEIVKYFIQAYSCEPSKYKNKRVKTTSGIFLTFSTKDTLFLLNMLRKLHIRGSEYKFYFPTEGYIKSIDDKYEFKNFKIKNASRMLGTNKYDLEVADNHNYIANDIVVHNCRAISSTDGLFSRGNKPWVSIPHIAEAMETVYDQDPRIKKFDGELYNHEFKDDFNKIISMIRKTKPTAEALAESKDKVEYWIYDCYTGDDTPFSERYKMLEKLEFPECIKLLSMELIESKEHLDEHYEQCMEQGYEGQMVRIDGPYEAAKRSWLLLKRKVFDDDEFEIVDIIEGKGNRSGMAGNLSFKRDNGIEFDSGIKGGEDWYKKLWNEKDKYVGQKATVRYFGFTPGPNGVPRFPVCIAVRNYE